LVFYLKNSSGTTYEANTANDAFSVGTWYNVICTLDATTMAIYIDNVSSATSADTFSGTLLPYNDHIYFGTGSASSVSYTRGTIDSPGLWSRTIVSGERATLQTLTYPF
jgi:methyl coenzyme M reductase beta subunit